MSNEGRSAADAWDFHLAPDLVIHEGRNHLPGGVPYKIRLAIGSDDGRSRRYDVHLFWTRRTATLRFSLSLWSF